MRLSARAKSPVWTYRMADVNRDRGLVMPTESQVARRMAAISKKEEKMITVVRRVYSWAYRSRSGTSPIRSQPLCFSFL
ncbi:hypothetical protein D3C81_2226990 [compost metagenome]